MARRRLGFTLVELLVVVSIIALLISILLPSLRGARDQAKLMKCLAHMRDTGQAAMVFSGDHDGRFQVATDEYGISQADPQRDRFAYDREKELLTWPVALAQAAGISYGANWDWGVRADSYAEAQQKEHLMAKDLEMVLCPSDRTKIATTRYPWNSLWSSDNNGLRGNGDLDDPNGDTTSPGTSYWGYLSFALNEDIAGAEVDGGTAPACWHAVKFNGNYFHCKGQFSYPSAIGCNASGYRLRGVLDRVFSPGTVGLVFEAGRDGDQDDSAPYANLITSAEANGPYLGNSLHNIVGTGRIPQKRHPKGRVNVLFADMHGGTITPVEFDPVDKQPTKFSPRVRVSPYQPLGITD